MYNLIIWADKMISCLKENNIKFINSFPILPSDSLYEGIPLMIENYQYRSEIPKDIKSKSLISFYSNDNYLINRILNVENEIDILKEYAGICGMDLSCSITMLNIRQDFSLLVSQIYNCYVAIKGIKVLPNIRIGDLSTIKYYDYIPSNSSFIVGELGCHLNGFKKTGLFQLKIIIEKFHPKRLYTYGNLSLNDIKYIAKHYKTDIIMFPSRRRRKLDLKEVKLIIYKNNQFIYYNYSEYLKLGGVINGS